MNEKRSGCLKSLELYRSSVDAASLNVAEGVVAGAYNSALAALMHLLNFANTWYASQESVGTDDSVADANLRVADHRVSMSIHLLLTRRICDLTGKVVALNIQRRLLTRDSILNKVLADRKVSDTSAALLFRLESVTAAFSVGARETDDKAAPDAAGRKRPAGFPDGLPDALSFVDVTKSAGYDGLVGVDEQVRQLQTRIEATRLAKRSSIILLYGPPGTGKTSLVVAAAKHNGLAIATVNASNLGGEFIGEREQNTTELFDYLEDKVTCDYILFIDEADSFLPEAYENNTQSRLIRVLTINRMLRLIGRDDNRTRIVVLASNHDDRIARDVAESSFKLYLAAPSTPDQMRDLVSFYRKRANANMTRHQLDYVVDMALALSYAPGHVSLLMQRLLTNTIIQLLNNRVVLQTVNTDQFEKPLYMMESDTVFEADRDAVTLARVTSVPRTERDDDSATSWERGNAIAFPVPDLNIDFRSIKGGVDSGGVDPSSSSVSAAPALPPIPLVPPPDIESEGPIQLPNAVPEANSVNNVSHNDKSIDALFTSPFNPTSSFLTELPEIDLDNLFHNELIDGSTHDFMTLEDINTLERYIGKSNSVQHE